MRRVKAVLTSPLGIEFDVTKRLQIGDIGTLNETTESVLTELTHPDMDLLLDDADGFISDLFSNTKPDDVWQFRMDRESGTRRPKWERLFFGILDLPWSVQVLPKDEQVALQVFGWSKILERVSAETVRRNVGAVLVNTVAGTDAVTYVIGSGFGVEFAFLNAGDKLKLTNYAVSEDIILDHLDATTPLLVLHAAAPLVNNFTNATMTLETPYLRNRQITELERLLFDAAGIQDQEITSEIEAYSQPLCQPINAGGVPVAEPVGLIQFDSPQKIRAVLTNGAQCDFSNLVDGPLVSLGGPTDGFGDLWPYYGGPATSGIIFRTGKSDNGEQAWDYQSVVWYRLGLASGLRLFGYSNPAGTGTPTYSALVKSGGSGLYTHLYLDYAMGGFTWCSFRDQNAVDFGVRIWDKSVPTTTAVVLRSDTYGQLRYVAGQMLPGAPSAMGHMVFANASTHNLEIYECGTRNIVKTIDSPPGELKLWTFRWYPTLKLACVMYLYNGKVRMRGWSTPTMEQTFDYIVASRITGAQLLTGWIDSDGKVFPFGYAGGNWFALSDLLIGIVPYADFTGMSCGAALKELALISGCYLSVDRFKFGRILPRTALVAEDNAPQLGVPLELERSPVWEDYRSCVKISFTMPDGGSSEVSVGSSGDSARTISVSPKIQLTEAQALGLGTSLLQYLIRVRREERGTWAREDFIHALSQAWYDGRRYRVVEASMNISDNEQDLRLIEIIEAIT